METTSAKMAPFANRTILIVDTLIDTTGVFDRVKEFGLKPYVVYEAGNVVDKEQCPHIDTIVVDSLTIASLY
jgi:osomolarity two-component system sensor histidine kinase NIK1